MKLDGDYTSGAESTGTVTRRISTSEVGDNEEADGDEEVVDGDESSDVRSVASEWSEFTARKHIPAVEQDGQPDTTISSALVDPDSDEEATSQASSESSESFEMIRPRSIDEAYAAPDTPPEEDDPIAITPTSEDRPLKKARTTFIPIPPEDYVAPFRPYRDPAEVANNRLPFMTPITERTESSLEFGSEKAQHLMATKTPCKTNDVPLDPEPMSSPLIDVVDEVRVLVKIPQALQRKTAPSACPKPTVLAPKGPIIKDTQCNPVDEGIRAEILANIQPPLSSYPGFYDHRDEKYERGSDIRKFAKAAGKKRKSGGGGTDRSSLGTPVVVQFPYLETQYIIKKELGAGAFAPVYLVENSRPDRADDGDGDGDGNGDGDGDSPVAMGKGAFAAAVARRSAVEALKMEQPPTPWEFHMMQLAHMRLGQQHRATTSLCPALECHLYQDETFLFLPYHPHGTLLDVVNQFRAESSGAMDELLAMFFAVELFRTTEALHAKQILHGDIKADNCLLRLSGGGQEPLASQWRADGAGGWAERGIVLIDFGRAIDMRAFPPDVRFIADWKTTPQDCAEMREGRPWTWHIDYYGLAACCTACFSAVTWTPCVATAAAWAPPPRAAIVSASPSSATGRQTSGLRPSTYYSIPAPSWLARTARVCPSAQHAPCTGAHGGLAQG